MKKLSILFLSLILFNSGVFAVAVQLSYKYANPRIIRVGGFDNFEFDVQVKSNIAGSYLWTGQINLNFDNTTMTTTAANWTVTRAAAFSALNSIGNQKYSIVKSVTGSPSVLNIALLGDVAAYPDGPNAADFVEITTSYQTIVTVRGRITTNTGAAGINFIQSSMNGQQSYISGPSASTNYFNPCLYDASDFTTAYVGRFYSTSWGWSQVGNSVNAQWVDWTTAVNTSIWEGSATIPTGSVSYASALNIFSPATFTIPVGGQLTASGTTTNSGTFNIQANATGSGSFIDNGLSTVTANVQRYVKDNGSSRWEYVSSPVSAQSSTLFSSGAHGLWKADETTNAWINIPFATPEAMVPMKGYARLYKSVDADANTTKTATGTLNTGTQSISVTNTVLGYNLVGNPYPSAIDWKALSGWSKTGIDDAVYYRTDGTAYSYIAGVGTGTATQYIPPMQSFWVHVTAAGTYTLQCDNNVRVHNTQNIYKTNSDNTLHLTVNDNTNGLNDDTYIRFMSDATDNFDTQYDAYKMFAEDTAYPQVYTSIGPTDISINSLSELTGDRSVALGFNTTSNGQFTLTAGNVSSFTDNGNSVSLEDLQTGIYQDLSANATYQFSSNATTGSSRFLIHFNTSVTGLTEPLGNTIQLFAVNNDLHIASSSALNGDVSVYDMLGQLVAARHLSGATSEVISLDPKTAVYIVKYISGGNTVTKRILINP